MVTHIDDCIGRIVRQVKESGLWDKTIFVFAADHGEMMGNHWLLRKDFFAYRDLLRVPMFIAGAPIEKIKKIERVSDFTNHIDLLPTLCSICGLNWDNSVDGIDISATLAGKKLARSHVFSEFQN